MLSVLKFRICDRIRPISRSLFNFSKSTKDFGTSNTVEPGNVSEERFVPEHINKPGYYHQPVEFNYGSLTGAIEIKTPAQINKMRESCKLAANILDKCAHVIKLGATTDDIDKFVHEEIISSQAYPSPLRYRGFPKSVCTSVNNVACHGIPDDRQLADGDMLNVDITVFLDGHHGDCSKMFCVGHTDERGKYLLEHTKQALAEAINCCGPNRPFNRIGSCIEKYARSQGLTVIPAFIGHGIGEYFHGPPEILHFKNNIGGIMQPGMTFTIEPILTLGDEYIEILDDGWTAVSADNARSAQIEHTVLITEQGVEILTLPD